MIIKILNQYSDEEFKSFMLTTRAGSRCRKLASLLYKSGGEMGKDILFRRLFGQKHTNANDYLLRNELSILKKKLEHHITENRTEINDGDRYIQMAAWCFKKQLFSEAEKYLRKARVIAEKKLDWNQLITINKLHLTTIQYGKKSLDDKLAQWRTTRKNHLNYLMEIVAEEVRYMDFIEALAYKYSANLDRNTDTISFSNVYEVTLDEPVSPLAKYYHYKSLAYSENGQVAIHYLDLALHTLDAIPFIKEADDEKISCLSAKAMEYGLTGVYAESAKTYEKILTAPHFDEFIARNSVILNYCTTLIKIKEYKKALNLLGLIDTEKSEPIVSERIHSLKCNCYIFTGDARSLKKILPSGLQSYDPALRTYYRLLYVIYYLIRQDTDTAQRELNNIKTSRNIDQTGFLPLISLFEKYLDVITAIEYKEKNVSKKTNRLIKERKSYLEYHTHSGQPLPGSWLLEITAELIPALKT